MCVVPILLFILMMFSARRFVFVVHKNPLKSWNLHQKRFITPLAAYNKRLSSGELLPDSHQKAAVQELEKLYHSIQRYSPKVRVSPGGGFFSYFSKVNDYSGSISSAAPKGVYIFGSVGGGKTTLMDMFFDCCDKVRNLEYFLFIYIM